jgi:polysaccharide export outer membrane protein
MRRRYVFLGFVLLAGCSGPDLPFLPAAPPGPYRLGAGDRLTVRIYDQPQLSGAYDVDDSGMLDLPLLGLVPAAGLTVDGLAAAITKGLQDRQLILHPSVAVEVSAYRPFYILGEVNAPGQYPYRPGMTVLTAISVAGGFTPRAVQAYVGVTRVSGGRSATYRAPPFALVQPGDVLEVFERRF